MADNGLNQIKTFVLEELKQLYPSTTVNLWFEPLKVVSIDGNVITVSIDSLKRAFVEKQYHDILQRKFSEVIGADLDLLLISDAEEAEMIISDEKEEKQKSAYKTRFDPQYTFENFVVGKSNELAQSASLAVAKHPAELNNPLFLYGPSGLGKTHLLFAIVNEIRRNNPNYNILYVTGEEFTNELIESLTMKKPVAFREKYRNLDVLLVDDIQFIAGKMSVQEEFFHTFNTLFQMNKQIILASDCAPRDIDNLEERLKTRFVMGLVADIQPPDLELRIAIFKRKAIEFGYDLDMEVLYFLAKNITTNVRQIEGALKKLKANSLITGKKCDYSTAKDVLSEYFAKAKSEESIIDRIFTYAEKRFGVTKDEIVGKKRNAEIIIARHCVAYLMRKTTNLSFKAIAKLLNKDHTTVMNSIDVIEKKIRTELTFEKEMQSIINDLKN